jgi:phage-related minor tail protein
LYKIKLSPLDLNPEEQRVMAETKAKAENKRQEHQEAEQHRMERELQFEAELKRMNERQRKKAKQRKRADARINQYVIKAAKQNKYYDVLGVRNWNIKIGPFTPFRPSQQAVKKAYRSMAKRVHPDKNKDGRADEAFRLLEESAAFLLDETLRLEHDTHMDVQRKSQRNERFQLVADCCDVLYRNTHFVIILTYRLVRPVSTPLLILGPLLI